MASVTIPIDFQGDPLLGLLTERGAFIPLRPLVLAMGLDWTTHLRRVQRDPVLSEAATILAVGDMADDHVHCLPLGLVSGFLFGIDASRVPVAVRGKVLAYQRDCFATLVEALLRADAPLPVEARLAAGWVPTRADALKLRLQAAFWSAVSAAIGAYLAVITLGRRGRRHG